MVNKKDAKSLALLLGAGAAGMVVTAMVLQGVPMLKNMRPGARSLIQIGAGMALMLVAPGRWEIVRAMGVGAVMAGVASGVNRVTNLPTLGRGVHPSSMAALSQIGAFPNGMGVPAAVTMNRPVAVRMNGAYMPGVPAKTSGWESGASW